MLFHYLRHKNNKFLFLKRVLLKLRASCRVAINRVCVQTNKHTNIQSNEVNAAAKL